MGHKIVFIQSFVLTQNLFDSKFFLTQFFLTKHFFLTQNIFLPKIFLPQIQPKGGFQQKQDLFHAKDDEMKCILGGKFDINWF